MATFPKLIIILVVVVMLARISALLARRFDLPTVAIQFIIGILLGPSLFNILGTPIILGTWGSPAPSPIHAVLKILSEIGLIQLMFLAGLGADWREVKRVIGSSLSLGTWEFLLTAVSVTILTRLFLDRWAEAIALSAIMTASSFGISAFNFNEMKLLGSRTANVWLGAAGMCGVLAVLLMIASHATNYAAAFGTLKMTIAVSWFFAKLIMFLAVAYFFTSRYLRLSSKSGFGRNVPRRLPLVSGAKGHNMKENYLTGKPPGGSREELPKRPRQVLIGYLLLVAALYAFASMHFGSFAAVGVASLGGALLGLSNLDVREKIAGGFGSVLASIFVGILFIVIGMEVNLRAVGNSIIFLALLIGIVAGAKLIGCWIATRKEFESPRERVLVALGGLHQGEMGILVAAYLFSRGLVDPSKFNAAIIVVVLLTTFTPIVMKVAQVKFDIHSDETSSFTVGARKHRLVTKN